MMREKIGGSRFGGMPLDLALFSFFSRVFGIDKISQWMVSDDCEKCVWASKADHDCLTSKKW